MFRVKVRGMFRVTVTIGLGSVSQTLSLGAQGVHVLVFALTLHS